MHPAANSTRSEPLTVGELIDMLMLMPQDAKVFINADYGRHYCEGVMHDDKANEVTLLPG